MAVLNRLRELVVEPFLSESLLQHPHAKLVERFSRLAPGERAAEGAHDPAVERCADQFGRTEVGALRFLGEHSDHRSVLGFVRIDLAKCETTRQCRLTPLTAGQRDNLRLRPLIQAALLGLFARAARAWIVPPDFRLRHCGAEQSSSRDSFGHLRGSREANTSLEGVNMEVWEVLSYRIFSNLLSH